MSRRRATFAKLFAEGKSPDTFTEERLNGIRDPWSGELIRKVENVSEDHEPGGCDHTHPEPVPEISAPRAKVRKNRADGTV